MDTSFAPLMDSFAFSVIQLLRVIAVMSQIAWQVFVVFLPVILVCFVYQVLLKNEIQVPYYFAPLILFRLITAILHQNGARAGEVGRRVQCAHHPAFCRVSLGLNHDQKLRTEGEICGDQLPAQQPVLGAQIVQRDSEGVVVSPSGRARHGHLCLLSNLPGLYSRRNYQPRQGLP